MLIEGGAVLFIQKVLAAFGYKVFLDGVLGAQTIGALKAFGITYGPGAFGLLRKTKKLARKKTKKPLRKMDAEEVEKLIKHILETMDDSELEKLLKKQKGNKTIEIA